MGVSIDSQYEQDKLAALCRFTKEHQIKMVALHEVACLSQDEQTALDVLKTIKNPKYEKSQIDYSLHSNMEMLNNFRGLDEAIQNTMEIANACNVNIKFGEGVGVTLPPINAATSFLTLSIFFPNFGNQCNTSA